MHSMYSSASPPKKHFLQAVAIKWVSKTCDNILVNTNNKYNRVLFVQILTNIKLMIGGMNCGEQ